jgi:tetratricopeptide (TPR) repeat protein
MAHRRFVNLTPRLLGWNLYLEPGEIIKYGVQDIIDLQEGDSFNFQIIKDGLLTKEVRLWNKDISFVNPIFECLVDKKAQDLNVIVYSKASSPFTLEDIGVWKNKHPASCEPYYYEACMLLTQKRYDEFLAAAEMYLFKDKEGTMPVTMTRYYCAMVYCYVRGDFEKAIKYLLPCLTVKPLMAEFWCLLGDIYRKLHKYEKAWIFYDNAIVLGGKRLKTDVWPMEIKKYKDYPVKMKESCQETMKNSQVFGVRKHDPTH